MIERALLAGGLGEGSKLTEFISKLLKRLHCCHAACQYHIKLGQFLPSMIMVILEPFMPATDFWLGGAGKQKNSADRRGLIFQIPPSSEQDQVNTQILTQSFPASATCLMERTDQWRHRRQSRRLTTSSTLSIETFRLGAFLPRKLPRKQRSLDPHSV